MVPVIPSAIFHGIVRYTFCQRLRVTIVTSLVWNELKRREEYIEWKNWMLRLGIYHSLFGSCIEFTLAKYRAADVGTIAQNRVGNLHVSNFMTPR